MVQRASSGRIASTLPTPGTSAAELLEGATRYVMEHGLEDTSMRQMAAALGTSLRVLQYHFGSREHLLGAVMHAGRVDLRREFFPPGETSRRAVLDRAWAFYTGDENRVLLRLFFHLTGLAARDPGAHTTFLDEIVSTWQDALAELGVREGLDPETARVQARVLVSGSRGLALDLVLTGEVEAVNEAYRHLVDSVCGEAGGGRRRRLRNRRRP